MDLTAFARTYHLPLRNVPADRLLLGMLTGPYRNHIRVGRLRPSCGTLVLVGPTLTGPLVGSMRN